MSVETEQRRQRPILFSGAMVRAILDGSKTQTRRVCKSIVWIGEMDEVPRPPHVRRYGEVGTIQACPYGEVGDRLWVRETFCNVAHQGYDPVYFYRADGDDKPHYVKAWKPSIFMPRRASRIELEIVSVRVERLQAISEEAAKAEGVPPAIEPPNLHHLIAEGWEWCPYLTEFRGVWEDCYGAESWDANPFVWVVEFKRVEVAA